MNRTTLLITTGLLVGCSADDIDVIPGRPVMPDAYNLTTLEADADLTATAIDGDAVLAGTVDDLLRVNETTFEPVAVYSDLGNNHTGQVRAITSRSVDALIAADNGLFYTYGQRLLRSDASDALTGLSITALDSTDDARIWIGAQDGIYQYEGGALQRWSTDGEGPVTAVREVSGVALVAFGAQLFELDLASQEVEQLELGIGAIHAIARGNGNAYLASDGGLVKRNAAGDYTQYTLSDSDTPAPVTAVGYDSLEGAVASTSFGVVKLSPTDVLDGVAALEGTASSLSIDPLGNVWLGAQRSLTAVYVGTSVSYSEIAPILDTACMPCHVEGGAAGIAIAFDDYDTAVAYGERMAGRINDVDNPMPQRNAARQLSSEERALMMRWFYGGSQP